jgi:hypothetical protein
MPHHKSKKVNNQQNKASVVEEEQETKVSKQAKVPASLNGVSKQ